MVDLETHKEIDTIIAEALNLKEIVHQLPFGVDGNSFCLSFVVKEQRYFYEWGQNRQEALEGGQLLNKLLCHLHR